MADVSVRPARVTDAEAAARAQLASWAEDGALPAGALAAASVNDLAAAWTEAIVRPPSSRHRVLVAVDADVVVGVAATAPHDDPDADASEEGALMTLTVAPVARGRGHGSRLLAAAVDTLREAGFATAYAWVPDERGLDFLVRAGWAEDGARRDPRPRRHGHRAGGGGPARHRRTAMTQADRRLAPEAPADHPAGGVHRRGGGDVRRLVRRARRRQRAERPRDLRPVGARVHRRQPVRVRRHRRGGRLAVVAPPRRRSCSDFRNLLYGLRIAPLIAVPGVRQPGAGRAPRHRRDDGDDAEQRGSR